MPELPEIETIARGLAPHLIGRRIAAVTVREADKPQRERSGSQGDAGKIDKDGPGPAARDTPSRRPGPERGRT